MSIYIVSSILAVLISAVPAIAETPDRPDETLTTVLHAIGLNPEDLSQKTDYYEDPYRLEVTKRILRWPPAGSTVGDEISSELASPSAPHALAMARRHLRLSSKETRDGQIDGLPRIGTLPDSFQSLLEQFVIEVNQVHALVKRERERFSAEERSWLLDLLQLVDPDRQSREAEAASLLRLAGRIDMKAVTDGAQRLLSARDAFLEGLQHLPQGEPHFEGGPIRLITVAGPVWIGGPGDDVYREPGAVIVDLAGNDRYEAGAAATSAVLPVSIGIDLEGSDFYGSCQARGGFGIGMLLDLSGDDRYSGGKGCQGSGIGGVGILEDRKGNDRYESELGSQGFGLVGIGLLSDWEGDDEYQGDLLVQGAAGPGGVGILRDGSGSDRYGAGGRYADFREDGAFTQSMAQGFGLGIRPLASGGLGILFEMEGDDIYDAGYFAQGSAHWAGAGLLIDRMGNDAYQARRYAQGAGSHISVGVLLEASGDDVYDLWGVGQGCGHDLSVGLLEDRGGNDQYRSTWMAQGVGNSNGVGLLDDGSGDDRYMGKRADTQGFGNVSRGYGSIGLLLDRGGSDQYEGKGEDGRIWEGGSLGAGIDSPLTE